jgi:hypothetical protein
LIQEGQTVLAYVAAVKRINGRRYLDPLKGFLIDKKNPATPLENPCVVTTKWTDKNNLQLEYYPYEIDTFFSCYIYLIVSIFRLKLALIQVSGDIKRRCNVEYNVDFNFAKRTVDEISKFCEYYETQCSY